MFKVGLALHSCDSELLFPTWMMFSAKSDKFSFEDIPSYWGMWTNDFNNNRNEMTRGSIMWWCKQDKPFEYVLFPALGHNTGVSASTEPFDIAMKWMQRTSKN